MSTYLAVADIGRGEIQRGHIAGKPFWTLVDPKLVEALGKERWRGCRRSSTSRARSTGPTRSSSVGSIVDDAPDLGYALETQSRPIYAFAPDLTTVVHETAHQWFGDSVGLERWPNIWLNEGFATWTEWYYAERHGGRTAAAIFRSPLPGAGLERPTSGTRPRATRARRRTCSRPRPTCAGRWRCEALPARRSGPSRCCRRCGAGRPCTATPAATSTNSSPSPKKSRARKLRPLFQRWLFQRGKP